MSAESLSTRAIWIPLLLVLVNVMIIWFFSGAIENRIAEAEQAYTTWVNLDFLEANAWLLIPAAFAGGLIASLSPCILALLPANLSYIGTLNPASRWEAFRNASMFVMGVVVILSLFGLLSSFAGAVVVDYKGYVHIMVGLASIILALGLLGMFKVRVPEGAKELPRGAAPFVVGTTFALVTSPCASPVLFAMLGSAGATGKLLFSVATMISYALGYTAVVFISSMLTGFAKQVGRLRNYAQTINRGAGVLLVMVGIYYLLAGVLWILGY